MDGNWKLCYAHCMFPVPVTISGYEGEINYPDVCPINPGYQSAFCQKHAKLVQNKGLPSKLRPFLDYCNKQNKGNVKLCSLFFKVITTSQNGINLILLIYSIC